MNRIKRAFRDYAEMAYSSLGLFGKMYLYTKSKKGTEAYVNLIAVYIAIAATGAILTVLLYLWSPLACAVLCWAGHYGNMYQQALVYMLGEEGTRYRDSLQAKEE